MRVLVMLVNVVAWSGCVLRVGYLENVHRAGNTLVVLHCVDLTQHGQSASLTLSRQSDSSDVVDST